MQIVALLPEQPDEAHFRIFEKAETQLQNLAEGNGLRGGQIRAQKHESLVHQLPAALDITLKPELVHTELAGAQPQGETTGSQQEVYVKAESLGHSFLKDKATIDELEAGIDRQPDKGWGGLPFQIPLKNTTKKTWSVVDKCLKCAGGRSIPCAQCGASGFTQCTLCYGQGTLQCQLCFGTSRVSQPDGSSIPCTACTAGRKMCHICQGQRRIVCTHCKGARAANCLSCGGSGSWTHVFNATWTANVTFTLDRKQIPEDVQAIADHLGVRALETERHAEIFRLPFVIEEKKAHYPMLAFLPIAKGEVLVAGKVEEIVAAGLHGRVVEARAFLDPYIKSGITALLKLSRGPMASEALIRQALKFRVLRDVVASLLHQSKGAVYKRLQKDYPLVVSDKYMRAAVKYAAQAILALGEGPRMKGLVIGLACSLVLSALWYLTPARASLQETLAAKELGRHILAGDIAVWVAGYLLGLYAIKAIAAKALAEILPGPDAQKGRGLPAAGKQGTWALFGSFTLWAACAFAAPVKPEWVLTLLKSVGIQ